MRKNDWDDLVITGHKGDFYFHHDDSYITIRYGDDVMDVVTIPVKGPNSWQWNGNREKPTLSPSILVGANLWHGWMRDGVLIDA
jgi:hypothetical protein